MHKKSHSHQDPPTTNIKKHRGLSRESIILKNLIVPHYNNRKMDTLMGRRIDQQVITPTMSSISSMPDIRKPFNSFTIKQNIKLESSQCFSPGGSRIMEPQKMSTYQSTLPNQGYGELKSLMTPNHFRFSNEPSSIFAFAPPTVEQELVAKNQEKFHLKIAQIASLGPECPMSKSLCFLTVLLGIVASDMRDNGADYHSIYLKFLNASLYVFSIVDDFKAQEVKVRVQQQHDRAKVKEQSDQIAHLKATQLQYAQSSKLSGEEQVSMSRLRALTTENVLLKIENQKLGCELTQLVQRLKAMEVEQNMTTIKEEISNNKNEYETELIDLSMKYSKAQKVYITHQCQQTIQLIQLTTNSLKSQKSKLETELSFLRSTFDTLDVQLKHYEDENYILNAEVVNYRERMGMQVEDTIGLEWRGVHDKDLITAFKKKVKQLQSKIDRTQIERSTNLSIPENPHHKEELDMFTSIRQVFKFNNIFYKKLRSEMKGFKLDMMEVNQKKIIEDRLKVRLDPTMKAPRNSDDTFDDTFDISKYSYMKPSFFSLISFKLMQYTQGSPELHQTSEVTCFFIGQVRGILDSKCNEQQLCESVKEISHFPEFTYGWLGRFQLDKIKRSIIQQNKDMGDDVRVKFYLQLANPTLNKLWEIVTFREFLLDRSSNDEIYFYLFYRNILFQGPQLQSITSTFQAVQYVPWSRVDQLISQALYKYDVEQINQLKFNLKERCVRKNINLVIDGGLVLRNLLEFYRQERLIKFKLIQDVFLSCASKNIDGKPQFDFESFKLIFQNNFLDSLELEKAEMYRDCYSAGRGRVTPEVFFAVATESNFFIKQLRLRGSIVHHHNKSTTQLDDVIVREADTFIKEQITFLESFRELVTNYGVEGLVFELDSQFTQLKQFMKGNDARDNSKTLQIILISAQRIQKIAFHCVHTNIHRFAVTYQHMLMRSVTADIERLFQDPIRSILEKNVQDKSDYECQIARVQKAVKNRIHKWYGLVNTDLLDKLIQSKVKQLP